MKVLFQSGFTTQCNTVKNTNSPTVCKLTYPTTQFSVVCVATRHFIGSKIGRVTGRIRYTHTQDGDQWR